MKKNIILIIILLLLGFISHVNAINFSSATTSKLAIRDSFVDSSNPSSNYGTLSWLIFADMGSGAIESYLTFDTSNPPFGWTKAEIAIEMYVISKPTKLTVSLITATWEQYMINWENKPSHGPEIIKLSVSTEQIYYIDVSNFISGASLSICINITTLPTGSFIQAASREGHLILDYQGPMLIWTHPEITPEFPGIPGYNIFLVVGILLGISIIIIKKKFK